MIVESLTVLVGIIMILLLAEVIIKNAVGLAKHYGISGTFIGLTVLSIGTSIPEIMTHIIGSFGILKNPSQMNTLSSLLIGTNIGSDIFQQNFILPVIGIIGTIVVIRKNLIAQMGALIIASLLVWIFSLGGFISRSEGAILLLAYIGYLIYLKRNKISESYKALNNLTKTQVYWSFGLLIACFIIMAFMADLVLKASVILVKSLPISASFFGVILLGIASALPELTTSLIAVIKKEKDVSAGILIGSNITNPLFGIGLGAVISSYTVPNVIVFYDLPVKILTAILIFYFLWRTEDLNRKESMILISIFIFYLIIRQIYFPTDLLG
jgi:cation:H+ antiporter